MGWRLATAVLFGRKARQPLFTSMILPTSNLVTLCSDISEGDLYMISIGSVQFSVSRSTFGQHITFWLVHENRLQLRSTKVSLGQ